MDVVLVRGRGTGAHVLPGLGGRLEAAGHSVRRIGTDPGTPVPPFWSVAGRGSDPAAERALSLAIRERTPDVVHVLAYGGVSSVLTPWIAERLGVPVVVSVRAAEVLCHRGTLVDELGRACQAWACPERCLECCTTPFQGGMSRRRARLVRWAGRLRGWSPLPRPLDFATRLDTAIAGLLSADAIWVEREVEVQELVRAGVPESVLAVGDSADAAAMARCYAGLGARERV